MKHRRNYIRCDSILWHVEEQTLNVLREAGLLVWCKGCEMYHPAPGPEVSIQQTLDTAQVIDEWIEALLPDIPTVDLNHP